MTAPSTVILAIDPGRSKSGIAVMTSGAQVLFRAVLPSEILPDNVRKLCKEYSIKTIVMGKGTGRKELQQKILELCPLVDMVKIPENNSTLIARERYFKENPPKGLWKLVPKGLLLPPVPYDDYAAVILGERFLGKI